MKKKFNKFQTEEMHHHDKEALFYAERNENDYIWEVPAGKFILLSEYIKGGNTVVDMGCGPAVLIKHILSKKLLKEIDYIGIDISKEMLKIAKKNVSNGKFIQDDMETVKVKPRSADVIISLGALHHSQNKKRTLKNWFSILKHGGHVLLREPTKEALKRGKGESPNEEGVDIREITQFAWENNVNIEKIVFFWSPFFHLLNKTLIKIGFGNWRNSKSLWYVVLALDMFFIKTTNLLKLNCKGDSVAIVLKKR